MPQAVSRSHNGMRRRRWRATRKSGRNVGIDARRVRGEPSPSTRDPASLKVQAAMPRKGGVPKDSRNRLSLNHPRQGLLGRGVADSVDAGSRRDRTAQGILSRRQAATLVQIKGIESGPKPAAQLTTSKIAGDVSSGSTFRSTSGPKVRQQQRPEKLGASLPQLKGDR